MHVYGFEIGVPIALGEQPVLPASNDLGRDGIHGQGSKGGKDLVADDGILLRQGRLLQTSFHV